MVFPIIKAGKFFPRLYSKRFSVNVPENNPAENENGLLILLVTSIKERFPIAIYPPLSDVMAVE